VLGVMLQRQERLVWAVAKVIIFTWPGLDLSHFELCDEDGGGKDVKNYLSSWGGGGGLFPPTEGGGANRRHSPSLSPTFLVYKESLFLRS
jgi:hypothetical protein